ncbi:MAG: DegQ family serine endoprotease [Deltaproteobacteria bacterium]|nr:DegQ family serine endoprotease [Deltaproteobacteria bacterium]MBW2305987.1 DegQ family serine endoprotease [Deltaproteobacteria bacterium]
MKHKKIFCMVMMTLLVSFLIAHNGALASIEEAKVLSKGLADVSSEVKPVVVNISSVKIFQSRQMAPELDPFFKDHPFRFFFGDEFFERFRQAPGERRQYRQQGLGSGFIVDKRGYILTNNHVVQDADEITVTLADRRTFDAKIIGTDPKSDLAVIKIEGKDLPVAKLGDSDKIRVGEIVLAVGSPFGLMQTVTSGIISAKGRANVGIADYEDFIQTDAAINPGNSGGPLINLDGEVIGINAAIVTRSGGYQGIGFAIPINMAKIIMDDLIQRGKVTRGWLGVSIQEITDDLAKSFGLEKPQGVLVADVTEGSPADKAGIKRGDVVMGLAGKEIQDVAHLRNQVAALEPGQTVEISVIRDGKKKTMRVTIGTLSAPGLAVVDAVKKLGLEIQDLTPEIADRLGYEGQEGVLVTNVVPGSPGQLAGLERGDLIQEVNRMKVTDVDSFNQVLAKAIESKSVLFLVRHGEYSRYLVMRMK